MSIQFNSPGLFGYRIAFLSVIAGFTLIAATACVNRDAEGRSPEARRLYEKSVALTRLYTDSLKHVSDSASIERLAKGYESAITKLNYEFAPDVYTEISEGENDTLTTLTMRFITLRDSLVYRLDHPVEQTDTVPTDSI